MPSHGLVKRGAMSNIWCSGISGRYSPRTLSTRPRPAISLMSSGAGCSDSTTKPSGRM